MARNTGGTDVRASLSGAPCHSDVRMSLLSRASQLPEHSDRSCAKTSPRSREGSSNCYLLSGPGRLHTVAHENSGYEKERKTRTGKRLAAFPRGGVRQTSSLRFPAAGPNPKSSRKVGYEQMEKSNGKFDAPNENTAPHAMGLTKN